MKKQMMKQTKRIKKNLTAAEVFLISIIQQKPQRPHDKSNDLRSREGQQFSSVFFFLHDRQIDSPRNISITAKLSIHNSKKKKENKNR